MESNWVDFRAVKASVTMQQVLDHYGIRLRKVNATYLRGKCPLPTHASKGSDDSFGVDLGKQAWACQSDSCVKARNGRRGGNILEFVAVKEGITVRDAALKIASWFGVVSPQPANGAAPESRSETQKARPPKTAEPAEEGNQGEYVEPNKPLTFALNGVDHAHAYLARRGISEETARLFGVGYFPGNGSMKNRIIFPIRNGGGDILAYAGRSIDDAAEPRWKFPSGFRKSLELFGLPEAMGSPVVAVVESFWGVLALRQAGIAAVSLMGRSMATEQLALLNSLNPALIVVLLDGDEPGRTAVPEIAGRITRQQFVRVFELPDGKQPDHLKPDELREFLSGCVIKPRD